jgi:hypothetical protein
MSPTRRDAKAGVQWTCDACQDLHDSVAVFHPIGDEVKVCVKCLRAGLVLLDRKRHTSKCNDGPSGCDPSCPIGIPEVDDEASELAAPGECQSLHKLRMEVDGLRADLARCRVQRDGTMDVLRKAQIEAGEDGDPIGVTKLLAERDEFAAEVAAYQGRPEGAINERWKWSTDYWPAWERVVGDVVLVVVDGTWSMVRTRDGEPRHDGYEPTPRAAMRAAESKACEIGLMTAEPS